ncbi:MAG: c-type cytochrome [Candidatus Binatia bacterium]
MRKSGGIFIIFLGIILLTHGKVRGESLSWEGALEEKLPESQELVNLGKQIFSRACFYCHGEEGKGDGKARRYLFSMPRDFTSGKFKVRTTATGSLPTDEDLFRTITVGLPEYRMPSFSYLGAKERWALVYYIKTFSPSFKGRKPKPVTLGKAPPVTARLLSKGKQLFDDAECWKCHGKEGKGNGPSAPDLKDDWGNPIKLWTGPRESESSREEQGHGISSIRS